MSTFNRVFKYQPIAFKILTKQSRYKRAESNLLADENGPYHMVYVVVWVFHHTFFCYLSTGTNLKSFKNKRIVDARLATRLRIFLVFKLFSKLLAGGFYHIFRS